MVTTAPILDGDQPAVIAEPPAPQQIWRDRSAGDAHGYYRKWRAVSPLLEYCGQDAPIRLLQATRHADVTSLLRDPRTRQFETEVLELRGIKDGALHDFMSHVMLASNPPVHARRRAPLSRTFAFGLMDAWRPHIRELSRTLIRDAAASGEIAFTTDIASRLPPRIVASVLGLDQVDVDHFLGLVRTCSRGLSNFPLEAFPAIDAAMAELVAYVEHAMAERRTTPRDDVLSAYTRTVADDGVLSHAEQLAQIAGVILAGSDTTRTGITSMMSQLLRHPDQWALVRSDPHAYAANTVLESLRYEPPVGTIPRITLEDVEVGDRVAPGGRVVSLSVLSALRDPEAIAEPDRFDVTRTDIPNWLVVFGAGAHRCLGEALARAEMEEMLIAAAELLGDAEIVGPPPEVVGSIGIRDIGELTLRARVMA